MEAVRSTDDDAAQSRQSCVALGYLEDPFANHFVKKPLRRPPLINVGTHVRTWAVDQLVEDFLQSDASLPAAGKRQVISLGAGSDTRYFRLCRNEEYRRRIGLYAEIDFPESTTRKAQILKRQSSVFGKNLPNLRLSQGGAALHSDVYHLLPGDLVQHSDDLHALLCSAASLALEKAQDTLIIAECLFIYLQPEVVDKILRWFAANFPKCTFVSYDPIKFNDNFGRMMISNLRTRQIELPSAEVHSSVQALISRMRNTGFNTAQGWDVATIRKSYVPKAELVRLASLEMVDEYEEIELVLSHYAVLWATNKKLAGAFSFPT